MKEFPSSLLAYFFSSYCESYILYNCAKVCVGWRKIIHYRVDVSLGREDVKIEILQSENESLLFMDEFTYIIENRIEFSESDGECVENEVQDDRIDISCHCQKVIHSNDGGKHSCSTMECPCFSRNYHGGKHFNHDGILELDYSFPILECSEDCTCDSSKCKNKILPTNYMGTIHKPLYLFSIGEGVGFGVKCKQFIKRGEFISEYIGQVLSDEHANNILNSEMRGEHNYLLIVKEFFRISSFTETIQYETRRLNINAEKYGNVSRFFNHGCEPNLTWRVLRTCFSFDPPKVVFFASTDIPENTELTFDYGEGNPLQKDQNYHSHSKCLCKSSNCRGFLPLVSI